MPQPPQLILRVGVSFSRTLDLATLTPGPALEKNLRDVVKRIQDIADKIPLRAGELYDLDQKPSLRILSGLEGGLSPLAEEVDLSHEEFDSILDIHRLLGKSKVVLDDLRVRRVERENAELAAKKMIVMYCDLWIVIADDGPVRNAKRAGEAGGKSLLTDIPTFFLAAGGSSPDEEDLKKLDKQLLQIFFPESGDRPSLAKRRWRADRERAARYLVEKAPRRNLGLFFDSFRYTWTGDWKKLVKPRFRMESRAKRTAFLWADDLATSYGGLYRSAFVFSYVLGPLAVLFAYFGVASRSCRIWFSLELLIIFTILFLIFRGRRRAWHQRWMDYRLLAEALRPLDLLAAIGRLPSLFTAPLYVQLSEPHRSWTDYYFHAVVRQSRLEQVKFGATDLKTYQEELVAHIKGQITYHKNSHASFEHFHRSLQCMVLTLFLTTVILCFLHLINCTGGGHHLLLNSLPLVLPAFGAALSAIDHHGEFEKVASRSRARKAALQKLKKDAENAGCDAGKLGQLTEAFSEVLVKDLADWRAVFRDKDLEFG